MGRRLQPFQISILLFVTVHSGCGGDGAPIGPTYTVQGRVLRADGQPLNAGRVIFVAVDGHSPPASGPIGPDGRFALSTQRDGDGAVPGQYKVRIEPGQAEGRRGSRPRFPLKYIDEDSSGLVVTVQAEPNELEPFTLK